MPCCYLAADVAGYSRLIGAHEGGTLGELDSRRSSSPYILSHHKPPLPS
jgi:hypothetical protein